ncbi:MAG TPA: L-lactate dehydrogenase [Acidobacteriota bacterium]|nr:L-lactate dehydrogenase [Acidobacteriota bacterium]
MKVCIIGAGNVGATLAYTLLLKGEVDTISLIDSNAEKAIGEALDLAHGIPFAANATVTAEGYEGVANADVIVITAGRNRRADESRLDLARANTRIMEEITDHIKPHYHGAILIIVSNPMDVLTYVAYRRMGISKKHIFGSGTVLDTSRFRYLLGKEFDVDPRNIHAYIIGEHGDSSVPVWSMASFGQIPVLQYSAPGRSLGSSEDRERIARSVVTAGKEVIQRKGATFYAIALSVSRILEGIFGNEKSIFTVSSYIEDYYGISGVCLSLPAVITRDGIREILPIRLTVAEQEQLSHSADVLKDIIREVGYEYAAV